MEHQASERTATDCECDLPSPQFVIHLPATATYITCLNPLPLSFPQSKTGVPLCSFENNSEYVYDVEWSPTHPAVFASVDGEGRLDFWNINSDTEVGAM